MRFAQLLFAGSLALALTAAPALARGPQTQKGGEQDQPSGSGCSSYQQAADGSWTALPCEEVGGGSSRQTEHRPAPRGEEEQSR